MNRIILNETSYFGAGSISVIPEEVKARGYKKALVVTDKDLLKFNVSQKVTELLDKEGLEYEIFSELKPNPTVTNVKDGVEAFKTANADYIIDLGIDSHHMGGEILGEGSLEDLMGSKESITGKYLKELNIWLIFS